MGNALLVNILFEGDLFRDYFLKNLDGEECAGD
jgi:hypothetical protein